VERKEDEEHREELHVAVLPLIVLCPGASDRACPACPAPSNDLDLDLVGDWDCVEAPLPLTEARDSVAST